MTTIPRSHDRAYAIAHPHETPKGSRASVKRQLSYRPALALATLAAAYATTICVLPWHV